MMAGKKSQVYAQALFELGSGEKLLKELENFSVLLMEKEILRFFCSFTVSKEDKKNLLKKIMKNSSPPLKNFFFVLLDNKAFSLLSEIVSSYKKLCDEKLNLIRGDLYSFQPLPEKEELEKALSRFFNKSVKLNQKLDKTLIAGVYIRVGDYVFNSTVKEYLKQFRTLGG